MDEKMQLRNSRQKEFLDELQEQIYNDLHKRIIQAYQGDDPLESMELELRRILLEVLNDES